MRTVSTFSFGPLAWAIALELEPALDEVDPVAVEPVDVLPVDVEPGIRACDAFSSVPVISTLWPTCALSCESGASSRYVLTVADIDVDGLDPAAPDVPVGLVADVPDDVLPVAVLPDEVAPAPDEYAPDDPADVAFVRMNAESVELAPVVPLVPVAPAVALDEPR